MEGGWEELKERTVEAVQRVFEKRGVELTNGDAPGLRVRSKPRKTTAKCAQRQISDQKSRCSGFPAHPSQSTIDGKYVVVYDKITCGSLQN